jgi:hypothetical protein
MLILYFNLFTEDIVEENLSFETRILGGDKQHMGTKAKPQINKVYAKELTARPTSGIS